MSTGGPNAGAVSVPIENLQASLGDIGSAKSDATSGNVTLSLPKYVTSGKTTSGDVGLVKWLLIGGAAVAGAYFVSKGKK